METFSHDVLIIGGGAAGLRAAIKAAKAVNKSLSVALVSKVYPMRSHTVAAEGGAAAVLRDYDNHDLHCLDTIKGSDYLADQDVVEAFVNEAPGEIIQLDHWGCPWSRDPDGKLAVRAFGGMSVKRTHLAADRTGFHILHTLFQTSLQFENIHRYDEWFITNLVVTDGRVNGAIGMNIRTRELKFIAAKAVIMATGGAGRVFAVTTNGAINTGGGMALAYQAGAALKDMEFIQFHPTGLPKIGILITEGARGEGGYLLDKDGERFLNRYVPNKMELGPRDIISRAIISELEAGRGFGDPATGYVHLDLRHLGKKLIEERLPFIREICMSFLGLDPVTQLVPVRPTNHYIMGGIHTNIECKSSLDGLYAAGETACVSLNGANRLGSNSLSECLVFGSRAGKAAANYAASAPPASGNISQSANNAADCMEKRFKQFVEGTESVSVIRREMQETMEKDVEIFRTGEGIKRAIDKLKVLKERYEKAKVNDSSMTFNTELMLAIELGFMLDVAEAMAYSAYERRESRGAHVRKDYPTRDDKKYLAHTLAYKTPDGPKIEYLPVTITRWQPEERKY